MSRVRSRPSRITTRRLLLRDSSSARSAPQFFNGWLLAWQRPGVLAVRLAIADGHQQETGDEMADPMPLHRATPFTTYQYWRSSALKLDHPMQNMIFCLLC